MPLCFFAPASGYSAQGKALPPRFNSNTNTPMQRFSWFRMRFEHHRKKCWQWGTQQPPKFETWRFRWILSFFTPHFSALYIFTPAPLASRGVETGRCKMSKKKRNGNNNNNNINYFRSVAPKPFFVVFSCRSFCDPNDLSGLRHQNTTGVQLGLAHLVELLESEMEKVMIQAPKLRRLDAESLHPGRIWWFCKPTHDPIGWTVIIIQNVFPTNLPKPPVFIPNSHHFLETAVGRSLQ